MDAILGNLFHKCVLVLFLLFKINKEKGKLTKKEKKDLLFTNQKLSWGKAAVSTQFNQEEAIIQIKSKPTGQGIPNNKIIKSYKKSSNATKNNNKIQNQIKNNKIKNAQIQSNIHPRPTKMTLFIS